MFKSVTVGGVALLAGLLFQPVSGQAGTRVDFVIGTGGYPAQYHPGQYPGSDYDDEDDEDESDYISCSEGRRIVRSHGFWRVRVLQCGGEIYRYQAIRRYQPWIVRVSARSGRIIGVRPVRGYY
jgi:hypothetical protein